MQELGIALGISSPVSRCTLPRPVVDGNGRDGGLEAIGQSPCRAEPLPWAANGQCELKPSGNPDQKTAISNYGNMAYSGKGSAAATTVNFFRKFPCIAILQGCKDSLRNFRRY